MYKPIQLLNSTNIKAASYDADARKLEIEFQSGAVYRYSDMGQDTIDEWLRADSSGKHFFNYIRRQFPFEKMS